MAKRAMRSEKERLAKDRHGNEWETAGGATYPVTLIASAQRIPMSLQQKELLREDTKEEHPMEKAREPLQRSQKVRNRDYR